MPVQHPLNQFYFLLFYFGAVVQFIINKYATAVLTDHYFFALTNFTLLLWRDRVVATTAYIAHYRYNSKPVAITLPDAIVGIQQTLIHSFTGIIGNFVIMFFFFFCFCNYLIKFAFFMTKRSFFAGDLLLNNFKGFYLIGELFIC